MIRIYSDEFWYRAAGVKQSRRRAGVCHDSLGWRRRLAPDGWRYGHHVIIADYH